MYDCGGEVCDEAVAAMRSIALKHEMKYVSLSFYLLSTVYGLGVSHSLLCKYRLTVPYLTQRDEASVCLLGERRGMTYRVSLSRLAVLVGTGTGALLSLSPAFFFFLAANSWRRKHPSNRTFGLAVCRLLALLLTPWRRETTGRF